MLQFFLVTFGEGITDLFLRPYNEKIWKFDPSMMDTQMVERIPKPPPEDIIRSARASPRKDMSTNSISSIPKPAASSRSSTASLPSLDQGVAMRTGTEVVRAAARPAAWSVTSADGAVRPIRSCRVDDSPSRADPHCWIRRRRRRSPGPPTG